MQPSSRQYEKVHVLNAPIFTLSKLHAIYARFGMFVKFFHVQNLFIIDSDHFLITFLVSKLQKNHESTPI